MRLPGQSCAEEMQRIEDDKMAPLIGAMAFIPGLLATMWLFFLIDLHMTLSVLLFITILGAVVMLFGFRRLLTIRKTYRNFRLGHLGERFVAEELDRLREDGYRSYHDIAGNGFNIDHVLVGPSGIYSIETKTRRQSSQGSARVCFDGGQVLVDGLAPDRDPIAQARRNAQHLQQMLSHLVQGKLWVQPIVFFPGWEIDVKCCKTNAKAWVVNERTLNAVLWGENPRLSPEEIAKICEALDQRCREKEGA